MKYLRFEVDAEAGDLVVVELDHAANVRLLDRLNFSLYRRGQSHRYHGGFFDRSPVRLSVPDTDHWLLVVDLGGYAGTVRASVSVCRRGEVRL